MRPRVCKGSRRHSVDSSQFRYRLYIAVVLESDCGLGQMSVHMSLNIPDVKVSDPLKESTDLLGYMSRHLERV